MSWHRLPARAMDQRELVSLVDEVAGRPELWKGELSSSVQIRQYVSLRRDQYVDVWAICWSSGSDTGWHDHDVSSGAVRVVRGSIIESSPCIGGQHRVRAIPAAESFGFGPDHIHRLVGDEPGSGDCPRLFAAAVAPRPVLHQPGRPASPCLRELRGGASTARSGSCWLTRASISFATAQ